MFTDQYRPGIRKLGALGSGSLLVLALLGGCSSSHPKHSAPQKPVKVELAAPTVSPSGTPYLPFVPLNSQRVQKQVKQIVQETDQDLAETRSAVHHLQEEEITGQFTSAKAKKKPAHNILEPGLVAPMPKTSKTHPVS